MKKLLRINTLTLFKVWLEFNYLSACKKNYLTEIFGNLELLLKISPPQVKYTLIDKNKGLFRQSIPIKKIKRTFEFDVRYVKNSENIFLFEIVSGPLKKSSINIVFQENNEKTDINIKLNLKLGLKYKFFSSIIAEKLKSTNLALIKRLENLSNLLFNDKIPISFENNYSTLILQINSDKKIFFDGWWLGDILSAFIGKVYEKLDFRDKIIIDVGSNIADSSIYFALNGAKKVIGLEPFPKNFHFGRENIKKNSLEEKIDLFLSGCSSKSEEIQIDPNLSGLSYKMEHVDHGEKIIQITLTEICNNYNIVDGVLKMNCEGCEYDVILRTPDITLKKFSQILIQYHDGAENLIEKLTKIDFKVIEEKYSNKKGQIFATLHKI